jgi:tetratricopeptide (TPR) repeat protein
MNKGNHDKAIADYSESIRLAPEDATAYYNRGMASEQKGDFQPALKDYQRFAELNPSDPDAPVAIARVKAALEKSAPN